MPTIGYTRVSSTGQNLARQDVLMRQLGVVRIYTDEVSGKDTENRPALQEMMAAFQPGDTLIVESISRFARNTKDLLILVDELEAKGVNFVSKKEQFDTSTPAGRLMLTVFAAIAQLEREYINDRAREGIAIAKAQGRYTGKNHRGRARLPVDTELFERTYQSWETGKATQAQAAQILGLTQQILGQRFRERRRIGPSYNPNHRQGLYEVRTGKLGKAV